MATLSDALALDTVAAHEFQKIIVNYLKINFKPKKIFNVSDGAPQHCKNKYNFFNLRFYKKDFGTEWHFHTTAHGKEPCDGIGGNLKRFAARASLKYSPKNKILTA